MIFDYIKTNDAEHFSFIRVPKLLVTDKLFSKLSAPAKFLYGIMLDRVSLSLQNGWIDERGNVYIYYTLNEIRQNLGCGAEKAVALMAELDSKKGIGLIERRKQGQGRPDIIYVKNFSTAADIPKSDTNKEIQTSEKPKSEPAQTSEKPKSRNRENRSLDIGKSEPSNTESNKPNLNETNPSFFQEGAREGAKDGKSGHEGEKQSSFALSDIERIKTEISEQVFLHSFLEERDKDGEAVYNPGLVRAVFAVIIELLVHTGADIYIDGSTLNAEFVKQQIRAITPGAFEYVLKGLQSNTNAVRNMKAYMRTAVYRAVHLNEVHSAAAPNTKTSYDLNDIDRICYLDLQNLTKQKG